jgi:hypothetical protein
MKPSFSFLIIFIFFFAISCKKDNAKTTQQPCNTCDSTSSGGDLTLGVLSIEDSNWTRQEDGTFKSDITASILQAGGTVKQVYSIEIVSAGILYQIYPSHQVNLMGGIFSSSINSYYNNEICTITYHYSDQNRYFGQLPNGGQLPFRTIELRILISE